MNVLIVGSITRDRIRSRRCSVEAIGGAVWHAGTCFARLGVTTRVVTAFSPADRILGEALGALGVQVLQRPSTSTSIFVNDYTAPAGGDRRQEVVALADPIGVEGLRDELRLCDLAYLGPLHPGDVSEDALSMIAEDRTSTIALDVQGLTRSIKRGRVTAKIDRRLRPLMPVCDVIKASSEEAHLLTGSTDPSEAATELGRTRSGLETMVTCAREGAFIASRGVVHFEPAAAVDTDNPTGAGDMYFAAYLTQRMQGESVESAARFAALFTARRLRDPKRNVVLARS